MHIEYRGETIHFNEETEMWVCHPGNDALGENKSLAVVKRQIDDAHRAKLGEVYCYELSYSAELGYFKSKVLSVEGDKYTLQSWPGSERVEYRRAENLYADTPENAQRIAGMTELRQRINQMWNQLNVLSEDLMPLGDYLKEQGRI